MGKNNIVINSLDKNLAVLGIISSMIFTIFVIITLARVLYVLLGVLATFSLFTYIILRKRGIKKRKLTNLNMPTSKSKTRLLSLMFFILFLLSVISIYYRPYQYQRPLVFFLLNSIMVGLIVFEVIFSRENQKWLILIQTIILSLSLAYTQSFLFPSLIGPDQGFYARFTYEIIESEAIPAGYMYSGLPVLNLNVALNSIITGFNYKYALFYSISSSQIIITLTFVYLIGQHISNSYKIGLFSAVFLAISDRFIYFSYWSVPNSLGPVFAVIVIYLLLKYHKKQHFRILTISLLIMFTIILTHSISAAWFIVVLVTGVITFKLNSSLKSKKEIPITFKLTVIFFILLFAWWTYISGHTGTIMRFIRFGFSAEDLVDRGPQLTTIIIPRFEEVFSLLGRLILASFSLIGMLYMISKEGDNKTFYVASVGGITLFLSFIPLITGGYIVQTRWVYFAQVFLCIPLAVSFLLIYKGFDFDRSKIKQIVLFVFIIFLAFLLIVSPEANQDNSDITPTLRNRAALTTSEMSAVETISVTYNSSTLGDRWYYTQMGRAGYDVNHLNFDKILRNRYEGEVILIRNEVTESPPLLVEMGFNQNDNPILILEEKNFSKIYDSGSVMGYKR